VNRWLILLLAIIGGAAGALAILLTGTVFLMGVLWLFVFGDDPWPGWVEPVLNLAIPIIGLLLAGSIGWSIWQRLTRMAADH
jgi:hypothetical protein